MTTLKQYVVDAFTDRVFSGNPAAVCIMNGWIDDRAMQNIAVENRFSETAFAVKENGRYHLRWFTPGGEVELCGHATLATASVILNFTEPGLDKVEFDTLSGRLTVTKKGDLLSMDFPSFELKPLPLAETMKKAVGFMPLEAYTGADTLFVLESEEQVRKAVPDLEVIRTFKGPCLHITARGTEFDCVTRSFAPKCGVREDPVCGRGHCHVIPYWAKVTGKTEFKAFQASERGGVLYCRYEGARTVIAGKTALFSEGKIHF